MATLTVFAALAICGAAAAQGQVEGFTGLSNCFFKKASEMRVFCQVKTHHYVAVFPAHCVAGYKWSNVTAYSECPPDTFITCPVTHEALSDAKKSTVSAIS